MRKWRTRILALVLALSMSLSCHVTAFAAQEDVVLDQVFGTSDQDEILEQAMDELSESEDGPEEDEESAATSIVMDEADAEEDQAEDPAEETPEVIETLESAEADEVVWALEDGTYVPEAEYTYTGEEIRPAYQVGGEAVSEAYTENWYSDEELTQETEDFINCGTRYLVLTDAQGNVYARGSYTIVQASQTISGVKGSYTLSYHEVLNLAPKAEGALTYSTSNKAIATVDQTGAVKIVGVGSCTITIKAAETDNYKAASKTVKITGVKADQIIQMGADGKADGVMYKKYVKSGKIDLRVVRIGDGKVTYQSSNTSIATVSATGIVTMKKTGTVKVTVTAAATANYNKATYVVTIHQYHSAKTLSYASTYKSGKYYKALMALRLSGSARANLLAIAQSQIGYHESNSSKKLAGTVSGSKNYTEYGRYYGYNGVPWCAIFVNWCARENGTSTSVIPKYCAVRDYYKFYHRKGQHYYTWSTVRQKKYAPKAGDLILYSNTKGGTTHHIGYVISATYTSTYVTITTVEGNTSDAVRKVTMKMKRSSTSGYVNGHYINGFASPNY